MMSITFFSYGSSVMGVDVAQAVEWSFHQSENQWYDLQIL